MDVYEEITEELYKHGLDIGYIQKAIGLSKEDDTMFELLALFINELTYGERDSILVDINEALQQRYGELL